MAWLDDHPPSRSQFRCPRREEVSGLIVVHTAENVMDSIGPDTGAEGVANFIRTRDTPGSYHELVDSDSSIGLVRWECEAFQDGTGSNPFGFGLSFAVRTTDWKGMTASGRTALIERGAQRAAAYAAWVKTKRGIVIPAERITKAASDARKPGFIGHGERDPGRRSDPGDDFPWLEFLGRFKALTTSTSTPPTAARKDDAMFFYERSFGTTKRVVQVAGGKQVVLTGNAYTNKARAHPDFMGPTDDEMESRYDVAYGKPIT